MDKLLADGFFGIITGILTTALLFAAKTLWDAKLKPMLEALRYQGVMVDGKWVGHGEDPQSQARTDITLFLEQSAHLLTGVYTVRHSSSANSFDLDFRAQGRIWEGYVVLSFTPLDRRMTSIATALLKIGGGGVALVGQISLRNVNEERVTSEAIALTREK